MPDAKKGDLGGALHKDYWLDDNFLDIVHFAEVVDVRVGAELIHAAEEVEADGRIMVAVDRKHRHLYLMIRVQVVCVRIVQGRKVDP